MQCAKKDGVVNAPLCLGYLLLLCLFSPLIKVLLRLIMKKGLLLAQLLSLFLFCSLHAQSQGIIVKGSILDAVTKDQLVGATIQVTELKLSASARLDGSFSFNNIVPGSYKFSFRYVGYVSKDTVINVSAGSRISIRLYPKSSQLGAVSIGD
jgi:hypothetical protein